MVFDYLPPADVLAAVFIVYVACLCGLGIATWLHNRNIARVPIRVHVGGSRGKTTTARYIGAALREAGRCVLVKTTGTRPLVIMPDGSEVDWKRWGAPSIAETVRFFRLAVRLKVDAVVLESMAIEPEYLWASETYLVRATHVALTNARPDHAEVLGRDADAMAQALGLLVPGAGALFLTDESDLPPIRAAAQRQGSPVTVTATDSLVPDTANRRLALAVCESLGLDAERAIAGFEQAGQDPGGFFAREIMVEGRRLRFHNAFACNDVDSLSRLWAEHPSDEPATVLLNARADRPERTRLFLDFLGSLSTPVQLVMTGAWRKSWIKNAGFDPRQVQALNENRPDAALARLASLAQNTTIWGIGNYADLGQRLADHIRSREAA